MTATAVRVRSHSEKYFSYLYTGTKDMHDVITRYVVQ